MIASAEYEGVRTSTRSSFRIRCIHHALIQVNTTVPGLSLQQELYFTIGQTCAGAAAATSSCVRLAFCSEGQEAAGASKQSTASCCKLLCCATAHTPVTSAFVNDLLQNLNQELRRPWPFLFSIYGHGSTMQPAKQVTITHSNHHHM